MPEPWRPWMRPVACVLLLAMAGCAGLDGTGPTVVGPGPHYNRGGPEANDYGAATGYPIGNQSTLRLIPQLVGSASHLDELFPSRVVRRAATPSALKRVGSEPSLHYVYEGAPFTLDHYLARNPTTGLLIAKGDRILVERYQYDRHDRHRLTSWSMAKTVTAMLIGIAIAEGRIRSVDDPAATYVPALAGSEYGKTAIRHLLQMSSGVRFVENYSGRDDVQKLAAHTLRHEGSGGPAAVLPFNARRAPAGTKFSYASVETQVLGVVLRAAIGRPVADYLHEKIWEPVGAEADASWLIDRSGQEITFCCLNAVLRDYARLGLLLAHDGAWRGRQIIPAQWILDATTVRDDQPHLLPGIATRRNGYGYQVWIVPGYRRQFVFLGVRGQAIFVDPTSKLVMAHTAVRRLHSDPAGAEAYALWNSVVATLGDYRRAFTRWSATLTGRS